MSLLAWYPLNGNIKNYGAGDLELNVPLDNLADDLLTTEQGDVITDGIWLSQSPAPVGVKFNNEGKIGKAYTGADKDSSTFKWNAAQTASVFNNQSISICFWLKVLNADKRTMIFGNDAMGADDNRKFSVFQYPTVNDLHLSWMNDEASKTFIGLVATGFFPTGEWVHCAIVYDNPNLTIYKNGKLHTTATGVSSSSNFAHETKVFYSNDSRLLNDFRVYDHALSQKEVREISQGLILHYPMNQIDGVMGGRNLFINSRTTPTTYHDYTGTGKASGKRVSDDSTSSGSHYEVSFPTDSETYTNYNLYTGGLSRHSSAAQQNGKTYTFSFKAKASKPLSKYQFSYEYIASSIIVDVGTDWRTYSITGTATGQYSAFYICIGKTQRDKINGGTIYVADLKLEEGSVATPWTPSPDETSNIGDSTIYDCSGYSNNGTIQGSVGWDNDGKLGYGSYAFSSGNYIIGPAVSNLSKDQITVSAWVKFPFSGSNIISCTEGGGWNFESNGGKIAFPVYVASVGYKSAISKTDYGQTLTGWHLITGTYDGAQAKIYIDGALEGAVDAAGKIGYSNNAVFIGAEAGGNTTSPASTNFAGSIQDVRIYATALSAEDVKNLYQIRYSIADNGTLFVGEYVEEDDSPILASWATDITSSVYGFQTKAVNLKANTVYRLSWSGYTTNTDTALKCFVYNDAWNWNVSQTIDKTISTYSENIFTPPADNTYKISFYSYKAQSTAGAPVHVDWAELTQITENNTSRMNVNGIINGFVREYGDNKASIGADHIMTRELIEK